MILTWRNPPNNGWDIRGYNILPPHAYTDDSAWLNHVYSLGILHKIPTRAKSRRVKIDRAIGFKTLATWLQSVISDSRDKRDTITYITSGLTKKFNKMQRWEECISRLSTPTKG